MKTSRTLTAAVSAAASLALLTSTVADAAPRPGPTPNARAHGIEKRGDAYMGWNNPRLPATKTNPGVLATVSGIDVSSHQGNVDWSAQWGAGHRFAYVKASEGDYYVNPYFAQQYNGSYNVGMIRGAYHFATPGDSGGAAQADYFVNHGGGWSRDGKTLPGVLDIEYNPYGATCYGLSQSSMVSWIKAFSDRYRSRTGRDVVIYTTAGWWTQCTGNTTAFRYTNPLWVARYASTPGTLPGGWPYYTFWQYTSTPIDKDYFNGDLTRLKALANG
ncbi:lysozyme [Luteipulveratus halotolerans]|uniref:Lysozyme n=1 Tax=Luteipulveratus halotolerans TaxID=1631356 RepID=A0A0L6CE71_9MICO|nr:lysozyme [Luteipulveratus halotolerans]KNX36102.1 lysozyme [Luteipulveratus halotolerans]